MTSWPLPNYRSPNKETKILSKFTYLVYIPATVYMPNFTSVLANLELTIAK